MGCGGSDTKDKKEEAVKAEPDKTSAYGFCSVHPTFTVSDWEKAKPIMEEFVTKTKTEEGCVYYGWTKDGDKLFCREAYVNGDAVNAHLANVGDCIDKILGDEKNPGPAKLDSIEIHGPAAELEKTKEGTAKLGTKYFATDGGFANWAKPTGKESGNTHLTIHPTFTVSDWGKAKPIMEEFISKTDSEEGCIYYGWTKDGDKLFCREAYVNGDAVNAHLANVGDCIGKILGDEKNPGPAKLDSIEIHGPAAELEKTKEGTAKLGTKYFEVDSGFNKFEMPAAKEAEKPAAKEAEKPAAKEAEKPAAKEAEKPAGKEAEKP